MRLKLIVFGLLLMLSAATQTVSAQSIESDEDLANLASRANVTIENLKGAAFSTGLTGRQYLESVGEIDRPAPEVADDHVRGYLLRVRLTYYTYNSGVTYSGQKTYIGSAACSWNIPLGARVRLPNGPTLVCNDRGLLGSTGWIDVYGQPDLVRAYGDYATVEISP
jgi:hypothetical protein